MTNDKCVRCDEPESNLLLPLNENDECRGCAEITEAQERWARR